ncbi:uncharacterized protein LOC126336035 [Schistocerca gregaria]|uniref:uncharacterized protein LOC126336035 n=1 Tax=Schistocerca gregaria TaxID=7010 RepID=UPI00211EACFD|nr:uncharacterized protein LOC126336035 [Schistocerca gregaria]
MKKAKATPTGDACHSGPNGVCSTTGRACEVVAALKSHKIDFCTVQETRWTKVEQFEECLMKVVLAMDKRNIHIFLCYAPQTGCMQKTEDDFWMLLDDKILEVPHEDSLIVSGDLNRHFGSNAAGY